MSDPSRPLEGMRVAILATNGFEQVELTQPREALERAGATTTLLSTARAPIRGFHHDRPGDRFEVQMALEDADPERFDAVLLPGGVMNADHIRTSRHAQEFVQSMQLDAKPIAVICHGPWLLVSAGIAEGRRLTSWPSLEDDLRNAGVDWVDEEVVVDGNLVSSRKPADLPAFIREMLQLFAAHHREAAAAGHP